jgi:hypothetical protein
VNIATCSSHHTAYAEKSSRTPSRNRGTDEQCGTASSGYFDTLKSRFPDINFASGESSGGRSASDGQSSVHISSSLLAKAESDPKVAARLESNLGGIPDAEKWIQNQCAARGMQLVDSGVSIDEDGNMSSWSVVTTAGGSDESGKASDEEDDEKRLEERRREKKAEEKYADSREEKTLLTATYSQYDGAYGELISSNEAPYSLEAYA